MHDEAVLRLEDVLMVIGGLALFLYGMQHIGEALKTIAGGTLRNVLGRLTRNRVHAALAGAMVTVGLQSSGATTLFLVGLSEAGVIELRQALGVILGADIGTTITVQLVAFNLFAWSPLGLAVGWVWSRFGRTEKSRAVGRVVLGAGLLFFGMGIMAAKMAPIGRVEWVADTLARFSRFPLLGIAASALFTALVRSSATTIVLALGLAESGVIGTAEAIPIILGANIGTCSTALIAAVGSGRKGWRIALAHVAFKIAGAALVYPFLGAFADVTEGLSSTFGAGAGRMVANAHTLFNLFVAVVFLPFTGAAERLLMRLLPERDEKAGLLKYLKGGREMEADSAVPALRRELAAAAEELAEMLAEAKESVIELDEEAAERLRRSAERHRKRLEAIEEAVNRVRRIATGEAEREQCAACMWALRALHHAATTVSSHMLDVMRELRSKPEVLPMEALASLRSYFALVSASVEDVAEMLEGRGRPPSRREELEEALDEAMRLHERRLKRSVPGAADTSFAFSGLMLQLYGVGREMENLKDVVPPSGGGKEER